jgi:lycopene beta-cyclase
MPVADVAVVGAGPAGFAAAAALAARGLAVHLVGPEGMPHWPAQYGAWKDELDPIGYGDLCEFTWKSAAVDLGGGDRRTFARPYVRVDKRRLAEHLVERCDRGGVQRTPGMVVGAEHHDDGTTLRLRDGAVLRTRLVVDASGHRPALVRRAPDPPQGFQTAFGFVVRHDGSRFAPGQALLMDWDDSWLPAAERDHGPPTFLYAMPLDGDRVFVEETVLVGRPAVPFAFLEQRLRRRLGALGISADGASEPERCWIPMGGALPDPRQRVIGFGGAAAMVHPATGYLLANVLRAAPRLADAVADGLGARAASPAGAARAAWRALWPAELRRRRALFRFGMEVLIRLDPPRTREFFAGFFDLPEPDWTGYFSDRLSTAELRQAMARLFVRLSAPLRAELVRAGIRRPGFDLARALVRPAAA